MQEISWTDFEKVDVRVGRLVKAEPFPEARKHSIKLAVDFGPEIGVKRSSAQITAHYVPEALLGKQVVRRLRERGAGARVPDEEGAAVLLTLDRKVSPGARMF